MMTMMLPPHFVLPGRARGRTGGRTRPCASRNVRIRLMHWLFARPPPALFSSPLSHTSPQMQVTRDTYTYTCAFAVWIRNAMIIFSGGLPTHWLTHQGQDRRPVALHRAALRVRVTCVGMGNVTRECAHCRRKHCTALLDKVTLERDGIA